MHKNGAITRTGVEESGGRHACLSTGAVIRQKHAASVGRLRLGLISKEDHCSGQEIFLPRRSVLEHGTKHSSVSLSISGLF